MSDRKNEISKNLAEIKSKIPVDRTLIVVTKTFPISDCEILFDLGERNFGENRESEGAEKSHSLAKEIIWHYQGEIQSQKIRSIVNWAEFIHSLDEFRHATKIASVAREIGKKQKLFIQINLDPDPGSRGGINPIDIERFVEDVATLDDIEIVGVMGIAPLVGDPARAFARLQALSEQVSHIVPNATSISAGMSHDFEIALRFGATHLRIGSSILGSRSTHA
jgi:pyridoxal phosphate enzyme (YggS family)